MNQLGLVVFVVMVIEVVIVEVVVEVVVFIKPKVSGEFLIGAGFVKIK